MNMKRLILVGNSNVGKSVIFNFLTQTYATVSNYPGTTVALTKGKIVVEGKSIEVVDTPGINSLIPQSDDERVTRDLLLESSAAVILQIADAKNLERALAISHQLKEQNLPFMLVVNMNDEAIARGIEVDAEALEKELRVPVIKTVAIRKEGLEKIIPRLGEARAEKETIRDVESGLRHQWAQKMVEGCVSKNCREKNRSQTLLERWTIHPVGGLVVLAGVLELVYLFVGKFGAGTAVDFMENKIFGNTISPAAIWLVDHLLPFTFFHNLLVGEYGLITMGLSYGIAIVFPIVTTFFIAFSLMEDSGYLPRLAVMVNKLFKGMGLNGKAVLPMVLGLGCDTMATMTTRILETRKQRLIVTMLLALAVPCSAQLGILLGIFGSLPMWTFGVWLGVIIGIMFGVGFTMNKILPGENGAFVMELPPLRWPQAGNVLKKTLSRIEWYVKEALPLFLLGTLILFILDALKLLTVIQRAAEPLVVSLLGLPKEAANAFLIGFLRRDYGATGFFDMYRDGNLSVIQTLVALVVITLFVPCIANVFMMIKEHGRGVALKMVCFIFPFAFFVGGILNWILQTH